MEELEVYGISTTKQGTNKTLNTYKCSYCNYRFKQYVCKGGAQGEGKRGNVSDQVRCKCCGNFLKTY